MSKVLNTRKTRSEIATAFLYLDGKPFRLDDYPMYLPIYDGGYPSLLLKTSRQVAKSTTISTFSIAECTLIPHFKTFFISPSKEQTQKFSTERVGKMLAYSPIIRDYFTEHASSNRVMVRNLGEGSTLYFSYAEVDAERCRGVSADRLCMDEIQSIQLETVLPIVLETIQESKYQYEMYCGTPLSMENAIEHRWQMSSRTEWGIRCGSCKRTSFILSETQLGKQGPICTACKAYLNPREGRWVDTNRSPNVRLKGFHISRPMMPKSVPAAWPIGPKRDEALVRWQKVLDKLEGPGAYALSVFRNEVLGISDSQGTRLVTKDDLLSLCTGPELSIKPNKINLKDVTHIAAGIDWSGGGVKGRARTVLVILGLLTNGNTRLLHCQYFPGSAPLSELDSIVAVLKAYDRQDNMFIGGDEGEGNLAMDTLRNRFQRPQRVVKFRYVGNQKSYIQWEPKGCRYLVQRTVAVDSYMSYVKAGRMEFPKSAEQTHAVASLFGDILNEFVEVTKEGKKRWDHHPDNPDDGLHALIFGHLALQISSNTLNLGSAL